MTENLLMPTLGIVAISAVGALAAASVLYGAFRKFSRMGWMAWQIAVVFALTLLLRFVPVLENKTLYFCIVAGACLSLTVIVLIAGAAIRRYMRNRRYKAPLGLRILDRVLGAVTALLDWALLAVVLGGAALYGMQGSGMLDAVYSFTLGGVNVWGVVSGYLFDLILVSLFVIVVKGGYKLGLLKSIWAAVACLLVLAAFFGSLIIALRVPFCSNLALQIAGAFSGLGGVLAGILGYAIVTLVIFLLISVVLVLLGVLFNLLVRVLDRATPFRVIDGSVLSLIFFAAALVSVCGLNLGVYALSAGAGGETVAQLAGMVQGLQDFVCSSPMGKVFYECNPLRLFMGG